MLTRIVVSDTQIYADVCVAQSKAGPMRQLAALLEGTPAGAAAAAASRAPLDAARNGGRVEAIICSDLHSCRTNCIWAAVECSAPQGP